MRTAWLILLAACGSTTSTTSTTSPPPAGGGAPSNIAPPPPAGSAATASGGGSALLPWPVPPFDAAQTAQVTACDVDTVAKQRYAQNLTIDALPGAYVIASPCDYAVLAVACASRVADGAAPPAACLEAYTAAIRANPAFAVAGSMPGGYFGHATIVAAPPVARRALVTAVIDYKWSGLGDAVAWTLTVHDASTHPTTSITGLKASLKQPDPTKLATAMTTLGGALANLLPEKHLISAVNCFDNYPEWSVTLTYDDSTAVSLTTNKSNLLGIGGPWQTELGGVTYLQLGPDLADAVGAIVEQTGVPLGSPQAMSCHGFDLQAAIFQ
nr:hypothetical protein [Kofleriaceae bacterium]